MKFADDCTPFVKQILPFVAVIFLFSCSTTKEYSGFTFVRKYQKNTPFVFKNNISLQAEMADKDEVSSMTSRLYNQIEDSAKVRIKDVAFVLHYIKNPPALDTAEISKSASNMLAFMQNQGYYHPQVSYSFDTIHMPAKEQIRTIVNYYVISGKRTTIDTVAYLLNQPELEQIAVSTRKQSVLQKGVPVTRAGIFNETNRLVDLYRNFGYYKFTGDQLRVVGDTTIEALTTVADDPFEQLRLLAEAAEKREKPTIRLGIQLNDPNARDSLKKYFINQIFVLPDFISTESYTDSSLNTQEMPGFTIKYKTKKFSHGLIKRNIYVKEGTVFRQKDYYKTINELYKIGTWESPTIDIIEHPDTNLLDLVIKMTPMKRFGFQGNIEMSYSANSSTSNLPTVATGNLLGMSANLSLTDRNFARSAIRMTNSIKAGFEFNTRRRNSGGTFINSREVTFNNSFLFPKFIFPFARLNDQDWVTHQSFINTNISFINRFDFYNQQIINSGFGFNFSKQQNRLWSLKLINFDFRRLYNRSARFDSTLDEFPFLRYSFNTALVMGTGLSYSAATPAFRNPNVVNKINITLEESGVLWGFLKKKNTPPQSGNFFNKYLREFVKADIEFIHSIDFEKSSLQFRTFAGVGVPLSRSDTTLPFFKQYFGGGPNSMRGWPVQGLGVGGQPLAPYTAKSSRFNDRTGDIQIEGNAEYRFDVAPLFSNAVLFKMAIFTDIGNIWNLKNTRPDGLPDSSQFHLKYLYKQLAMSSGIGFRFDFDYFLIRFDMGFRFKRPDLWTENAGWQFPNINFKNLFGSALENRIWRYQNFNASIGINYPF
ncbi:MAG: BamA/TamA family outer membrane protein [Chitinophagaceae bacterium]|nr:BamA/TamA family outer membrane protein [Chitinophagaceae bacterium]